MQAPHRRLLLRSPLAAAVCLLSFAGRADAGGSIFALEDELLNHPWHLGFMFIAVIIISVCHEILFEYMDKKVQSESGKRMKDHLQHEVMNLGLIGLWLTFIDALGITKKYWSTVLFHYTHFVLFVMMVILMGLTGTLLVTMKIVWKTWVRYERFWRLVVEDPDMPHEQKELTLNIYWDRNQNAKRMINCLKFFNTTVPDKCKTVEFTRYLQKAQRRWLLQLLHLNKYSWLSLIVVICIIASVLQATAKSLQEDGALDIFYFVFAVGWGTLIILLFVVVKTIRSFRMFCEEIDVTTLSIGNYYRGADPNPDISRYFWFGRPKLTIQLLQIVLLYQVFYMAIVIVNIVPAASKIPLGWVLVISSCVPTIAIFGFLLPAVMPPFTCLASLGSFLDIQLLEDMVQNAEREVVRPRSLEVKELTTLHTAQQVLQQPGGGGGGGGGGAGAGSFSLVTPLSVSSHP